MVFHSPVLVKAVEGRDAVAAIFATSVSVWEGRYVLEHKLDEHTTFLWWKGTINGHEIESFDVLVDNDYVHGDHADEHALEVGRANPAACTPLTQGARPGAQPPRRLGHDSVPPCDHRDYVVAGGVLAEIWRGRNPRAASARLSRLDRDGHSPARRPLPKQDIDPTT